MKLKEYIEHLQTLLNTEGDLDLIYSIDDEGNAYNFVQFGPEVAYIPADTNTDSLNSDEVIFEEDKKDEDPYTKAVVIN